MKGCHHCKHFITDMEYGWYENEDPICMIECMRNHYNLCSSRALLNLNQLREALSKGDKCKDFEKYV